MSIFDRFFRTEDDDRNDSREFWQEALEFSRTAYSVRLLAWIEEEAMRPVRLDQGRDMVTSAARQNAFLEVRQKIRSDIERARQAVTSEDA